MISDRSNSTAIMLSVALDGADQVIEDVGY